MYTVTDIGADIDAKRIESFYLCIFQHTNDAPHPENALCGSGGRYPNHKYSSEQISTTTTISNPGTEFCVYFGPLEVINKKC